MGNTTGGDKRGQRKLTRESLRFQLTIWSIWTLLQFALVVLHLVSAGGWEPWDFIYLAAFVFGVALVVHLWRVRHHDRRWWGDEEQRRLDLERRGRAL